MMSWEQEFLLAFQDRQQKWEVHFKATLDTKASDVDRAKSLSAYQAAVDLERQIWAGATMRSRKLLHDALIAQGSLEDEEDISFGSDS